MQYRTGSKNTTTQITVNVCRQPEKIHANMPKGQPFQLTDYLELVDWCGRIIREDKNGEMDNDLPPPYSATAE